ncbi:MAG: hypothetical protein WCL18_06180 [bacterium]
MCFVDIQTKTHQTNYQTYFAVLPHFAIQPTTIDTTYQSIMNAYNLSGKSLEILIISPDHFDQGNNTLHQEIANTPICFQSTCLPIYAFYVENIADIPDMWIKEHGR